MTNCNICGKELDQPQDPTSEDCGGDCLRCMGDAGDPDCAESLRQMALATEAECDAWLIEEGQSFASPEAWWATKAYMKARGFEWPEDTEDSHA